MSGRPAGEHRGQVLLGILQLALLRADGIRQFGGTKKTFLNSLAPLIAFPLVGGVLSVLSGGGVDAVVALLGTLVALLAPPVLSEVLARWWGREQAWLRYATAFNWSRWAMVLALGAGLVLMGLLASAGLSQRAAVALGLVAVAAYGAVLDWFVARVGLGLVWWRAALLVLVVNFGAALLFLAPRVLGGLQEGQAP
jgi:hypothetical protein